MQKVEKLTMVDFLEAHSESFKIEMKNFIGFFDEKHEIKINSLIKAIFIDSSHPIEADSHFGNLIKPGDRFYVVNTPSEQNEDHPYPAITVKNLETEKLITIATLTFINLFASSELPE